MTDDKEWREEARELTITAFWVANDGGCFGAMLDKAVMALRRAITELEAKEVKIERVREIVSKRKCGDGSCIWAPENRKGMHTNGGCRSLRASSREARKEIQELARELLEALGDS